ncbi:MAG: hypothetical protein C0467_16195 [Planctomycetaceae bacterium]|nr:hypothetical protein [Planctomycetaceae bacterium]
MLFGDLVDAVRRESVAAVAYYWGVTAQTVTKWRKALRVGALNEGTTRLKSASAKESPGIAKALLKAKSKARDPERRQKIAEARRGKPRPIHVIEAMRNGRAGKPQSDDTRNKIRDAHLRRGTLPQKAGRPWTEQEQAMLGQMSDTEVAQKTKRKVSAVIAMRYRLRIGKYLPLTGNNETDATSSAKLDQWRSPKSPTPRLSRRESSSAHVVRKSSR